MTRIELAKIELANGVLTDIDRFVEHLASFENSNASDRISETTEISEITEITEITEIIQAIQILAHSPLIGHKVKDGKRELVIGHDSRGCVALYRFVPQIDAVFVLALRSQRELGFPAAR